MHSGQTVSGFEITEIEPLPELRAQVVRAAHARSGAQLLHVHAPEDAENLFAVTFATPPPDDTGLPHILEHVVLGGSRRFPVKEPFFEMVKMSMATFINALTYQAFTTYPVASNVKKDFFNLVEVYLDAVFHPELKEETFRREGHHLALENNRDLTSPLRITGIVYNEMKGAYSSPETRASDISVRGLFPDTPLGRDSGGDPKSIPELTYDQFRRYYETYYHPANARIFIYGDIPTAEHFAFLDPVLREFNQKPVSLSWIPQPRWDTPRTRVESYPVQPSEPLSERTFLTLNWIVGDACDPVALLLWQVLDLILLGHEAAPLRKALVDSHLGADVFMAGADAHGHELTFHVGLKGSEPDRAEPFEQLVLRTLAQLADQPFDSAAVEAAFQQFAYHTLEVTSQFPLRLLSAVNTAWPFGADPVAFLRLRRHWEDCRRRYAADRTLFNRLLREQLLLNPHRLRVALVPDPDLQRRQDEALRQKLAALRAQLSPSELQHIADTAAALEAAQSQPNPPEAVAKLPQLKVSDLPVKPGHIPTSTGLVAGITVLRNDVFSNGVNYLEVDVDLAGLPADAYAWLPRFCDAVHKMGAAGQPYTEVAARRAACTGGLWCHPVVWRHATHPDVTLRRLRFGLKALDDRFADALALLTDLVFAVDPRDTARLRDVIVQTEAAYRSALINEGLNTARSRAARHFSPEAALEQQFLSPETLRTVHHQAHQFDQYAESLIQQIEFLREFLRTRPPYAWTVSFTGSDLAYRSLERQLFEWCQRLQPAHRTDVWPVAPSLSSGAREGLAGPMTVAYCVEARPAPHLADPDVPLFRLGVYLARFDYLLPLIRFKGNAYGAGIVHDDSQGTVYQFSFRDPHIVKTIHVFQQLPAWLAAQTWTQTDIDRAIIGSAREAERPIRPAEATATALARHLRGDTPELREWRYDTMRRATPKTVRDTFLKVWEAGNPAASICVVSSREKLEEANRQLAAQALQITDILPSPDAA
ncbi:MAG: insulinase family protein [Verrucomicrobiae bacterium]|nr:insulinase family protein [Verrucomicrobiae bacterium]